LDAVKYLADQHDRSLFYSRFLGAFLGNGQKEHETAFFWSRCYGMTKKVKHQHLPVLLFILPISLS